MKTSRAWFSLIEILVGILIVSIVMVAAFQALSSVGIAKVKLVEKVEIEKQAYFASEKLFELIKKGGTIDYEEYWNRYSYEANFWSGHFLLLSWFWNFWRSGTPGNTTYGGIPYDCVSNTQPFPAWWAMGTNGCLNRANINDALILNQNYQNNQQRYGQYGRQFIDRNSDNDSDNGDEDWINGIIWDDDDLFIGVGPNAFQKLVSSHKVWELYLINSAWDERTYFRWKVETATWWFVPTGAICDYSNPENPQWEACQGTIETLKLQGKDYGYNHTSAPDWDGSEGDGIIDTWIIHPDFNSASAEIVAWSTTDSYWQPVFPNSVNISNFELYVYPKKDLEYSWRDSDSSILVSPYIQMKYTISPSLKVQAKIIGEKPSVDISTTIQLSPLDIR